MTAPPIDPGAGPDVGVYDVIHLGGQAAVVVPLADFLRLRALERRASAEDLEDAEDAAALQDWQAREASGQTSYLPADAVRSQLGRYDHVKAAPPRRPKVLSDPRIPPFPATATATPSLSANDDA